MRDDFPIATNELLAKRVAYRCSNPGCRHVTSGPQEKSSKSINIGVAAHITAASPAGPRYDASLSSDQRQSHENGIWLCQTCAKFVDNDPTRYGIVALRQWKEATEAFSARALERLHTVGADSDSLFIRLERVMPDLLAEMRDDLAKQPTARELVVLKKTWIYNGRGHELAYYYEDHPDLENKLHILQNSGLIRNIRFNNVLRYLITEKLAVYLGA